MYLPDWIQPYKEPRTEIKRIKNRFYKYEVAFIYNRTTKKTEKKTIRLLGSITEQDGFIPSAKNKLRQQCEQLPTVDIQTFGVYHLFSTLMREEIASLCEVFGDVLAPRLLSFAMMRWAYQTPIKRAAEYHAHDFCSQHWSGRACSDKIITGTLKTVGENRQKVVAWMRSQLALFPAGHDFMLMDSTHTLSRSEHLAVNAKGYNPDFHVEKQLRLMYIFSSRLKQPVYYRLLNGNITDVKSMSLCMREADMKNKVVFIADKGFFSEKNVQEMEAEGLSYMIPLRRCNSRIDFSPLEESGFKRKADYFLFQNRIIWHYSYSSGNYALTTFLDDALRAKEEHDYLSRIETHPETYSREGFDKKTRSFGTLTLLHRVEQSANLAAADTKTPHPPAKTPGQALYEAYKQRNEIEMMFDSYKNYLDADVTYMQHRYVLEGWLFANFIAMIAYYKLYSRLREANLLSKYSPKDILELSKAIYKMKIRENWHLSEITEKHKRLFQKIHIDYLT